MIPYFICFVLLAVIFVLFPRKHATKRVAVILHGGCVASRVG